MFGSSWGQASPFLSMTATLALGYALGYWTPRGAYGRLLARVTRRPR